MKLLNVDDMPAVEGCDVPNVLYFLLQDPPLAGMRMPNGTDWKALYDAGLRSVVCVADAKPSYNPAPLALVHATDLQDLLGGSEPVEPSREIEKIKKAVSSVVSELDAERGVVVHCVGGRGRTGTVVGCVLRELGASGDQIVQYLVSRA